MSLVESLPERPLLRTEVDQLENNDSVTGIFPVYGSGELSDVALGIVLVTGETVTTVAYAISAEEWHVIDRDDSIASTMGGIQIDHMDRVDELQQEAIDFAESND